jgi:transcriptional regulator with XRE-family HTH domain
MNKLTQYCVEASKMIDGIGKRIRERRLEIGMTQQELSRLSNLAQSAISKIESGDQVGSTHLVEIAAALGVRAEELTGLGLVEKTNDFPVTEEDMQLLLAYKKLGKVSKDTAFRVIMALSLVQDLKGDEVAA